MFEMDIKTKADRMIKDGLWDAFNDYHMGVTAENVAEKWNVTREEQGYGAFYATKAALDKINLKTEDIDLIEANEAYASQSIAIAKDLKLDINKVNVNGGAIELGHPIGASGARILVTLLHAMEKRDSKRGLATLCIGGGQGTALVVERE